MDQSTSTSRRSFLRTTGAAGATLAAGAALASSALPGVASAADATTTTVPTVATIKTGNFTYADLPKSPTPADLQLIAFGNSLALAAVQIYDAVITAKTVEKDNDILISFRENHRTQAGAFSAMGGTAGAAVANRTLLSDYAGIGNASQPLPMLNKLEESLLATYGNLLGTFVGTNPAALSASILPILARQLVVLGQLQQLPPTTYLPSFDETTGALTISAYPVERV